jgi:hypothetical protein
MLAGGPSFLAILLDLKFTATVRTALVWWVLIWWASCLYTPVFPACSGVVLRSTANGWLQTRMFSGAMDMHACIKSHASLLGPNMSNADDIARIR